MSSRNFLNALLLFFHFTIPATLLAQDQLVDSVAGKMALYRVKNPRSLLFIHFDKTVYTANETAWLTGYLLKNERRDQHTVLSVALVNAASRKVIVEKQFVMKDDLAFGDIVLPDSLPGGRYIFMAYTNLMRNSEPDKFFVQPITIKTVTEPPFTASLKLVDSTAADGFYKVQLEGFNKERMLLSGAELRWYPALSKTAAAAKTDSRGEYIFNIPAKDITAKNALFETDVTYLKETRKLKIRLPFKNAEYSLRCFPEGGYLINGIEGFVGVEATSASGAPVLASAVLFKDGKPADTVQTNSHGIGRFALNPVQGSVYTLVLGETIYTLPPALAAGPVVTLRNAVANDTLSLSLRTNRGEEKLTILIHDYTAAYMSATISKTAQSTIIRLPLNEVPRGVAVLTVLDELGRPCAERIFFAHYDHPEKLTISTEKEEYSHREKVTVSLNLRATDGTPHEGIVSVACIQDNRLEGGNRTDIENYMYLQNILGQLPPDPLGKGLRNKSYLNDLLLVKGWRKYTWQEMAATLPADTAAAFSAISFSGKAFKSDKPLKKRENISIVSLPLFALVGTSDTGDFSIPDSNIVLQPDKKAKISISTKFPEDYGIQLENPYVAKNKFLAALLPEQLLKDEVAVPRTATLLISRNERAITLGEVKLSTRKDQSLYSTARTPGSNPCGDYICSYNILNCRNHVNDPGNTWPIEGGRYAGLIGSYKSCGVPPKDKPYIVTINGIYLHKEYYGADYSEINLPLPDYLSTIYWNHAVLLADGKASFSFYTSDITGKFTIIAQGITRNDVIYAEKSITVNKRKAP